MTSSVLKIITRLVASPHASRDDLTCLLSCDDAGARLLYDAADRLRAQTLGDEIHLRGLIEFSNHCRRNCSYCGLRRDHRELNRYRMEPEEIVNIALAASSYGYRTIVLQSGEDLHFPAPLLADIIISIKAHADIALTLSIGERSEAEYRLLREVGADRFLLRIETSSPRLYQSLHPDSDWSARRACLHTLRQLGYQVGSGVLVGLPEQSLEMLADDLLFLQSLDLDMVGIGPFIPHPDTPLANASGGSFDLALRFLACLRLLCPLAFLPATTALGALHPDGWELGLRAGADVLMPNLTPDIYRDSYDLYPGKVWYRCDPRVSLQRAELLAARLGRKISHAPGHSRLDEKALT